MIIFDIVYYSCMWLAMIAFTGLVLIGFPIGIVRAYRETKYEREQRTELNLLSPFLSDVKLWSWNENKEALHCYIGQSEVEIRPNGFCRSYGLTIWMKDYKSDTVQKVFYMKNEDGINRIEECVSNIVDENTVESIKDLPLADIASSFLSQCAKQDKKEETLYEDVYSLGIE